jgi:hypothetical protein
VVGAVSGWVVVERILEVAEVTARVVVARILEAVASLWVEEVIGQVVVGRKLDMEMEVEVEVSSRVVVE